MPEHLICGECAKNPFLAEKYRVYLAGAGLAKQYLETLVDDRFENFGQINSGVMWDYLIKYHGYYEKESLATRKRLELILSQIPSDLDLSILDVGFGYGDVLVSLSRKGYSNLTGVDISVAACKKIAKKVSDINVALSDAWHLPFRNNSFDIVLANEILEHIPVSHTFSTYDEFSRVLRPNGQLIISVPLNEKLENSTFLCPHGTLVNPNGHVRIYTTEVLKLELKEAGFRIREILYAHFQEADRHAIFNLVRSVWRKLRTGEATPPAETMVAVCELES